MHDVHKYVGINYLKNFFKDCFVFVFGRKSVSVRFSPKICTGRTPILTYEEMR